MASFDEPDLDLRSFLGIFWRQKYLILTVAIVVTGAAAVYSLLQTPVYEASATVLVDLKVTSGQDPNDSTNPIQATQQAIISEIQFAQSDQVADIAREDLEEKVDMSAKAGGGSALRMVVTDGDRDVAAEAANAYAHAYLQARGDSLAEQVRASNEALQERIAALQTSIDSGNARLVEIANTIATQEAPDPILGQEATQLQFRVNTDAQTQAELRGRLAEQQGQVQNLIASFGELTEEATPPSSPTSPDLTRDLILGFAAGLLLGLAIAFARHLLDDRARTRSRLESQTGAPTLATLPQFAGRRREEAGVAMVDAFRGLRAALEFASLENPFHVLAVVSPVQGDGKTTVAANLAIALAQAGQRTIAVDLDLRGPSLHRALAVSPAPGWTSITVPEDVRATLQESSESPRLHVVAAGPGDDDPADVLIPPRLEPIIADLKSRSDVVVLDTPAVLATTDAQVIVRESDAVLLVVSASTSRNEIDDTLRALDRVGAKVVGTVLNRADIRVRRYEVEPGDPELPTPSRASTRKTEPAPTKASTKGSTKTATAPSTTKAPPRKRAPTRTNPST